MFIYVFHAHDHGDMFAFDSLAKVKKYTKDYHVTHYQATGIKWRGLLPTITDANGDYEPDDIEILKLKVQ